MKAIQPCGYKNCVGEGIILKYEINFLSLVSLAFSFPQVNVVRHFHKLACQKQKQRILKVHFLTAMTFFSMNNEISTIKNPQSCSEVKCNSKGFSKPLVGSFPKPLMGTFPKPLVGTSNPPLGSFSGSSTSSSKNRTQLLHHVWGSVCKENESIISQLKVN